MTTLEKVTKTRNTPDRVQALVFLYFGAPLIIGAIMGWNRVGFDPSIRLSLSFLFWLAFLILIWLGAVAGSWVIYKALRPLRPSFWLITFLGPIVSGIILLLPYRAIIHATDLLNNARAVSRTKVPIGFNLDFIAVFTADILPGTLLWMGLNFVYDRYLQIPRYRYPPKVIQSDNHKAALLSSLLPPENRGDIIAIKAEDHYVRIYTTQGEGLIHMRLSDAIASVHKVGFRTHRSWWAAIEYVKDLQKNGQSNYVELTNGLSIPVSRSYLNAVRSSVLEHNENATSPESL